MNNEDATLWPPLAVPEPGYSFKPPFPESIMEDAMAGPARTIPDDINGLAREHQGKDGGLKELDFRRNQLHHYLQ